MTPKEKAEELVSKYEMCTRPIFTLLQYEVEKVYNKECALIAVNEIIKNVGYRIKFISPENYEPTYDYDYWEQVKQEIEKL